MSVAELSDFKTAEKILTVYPPILLSLGLAGNILSVVVLSQANNRKTSTGALLIFLAVTDSLILINSVFVRWLEHLFEVDFRNSSTGTCKFHVFISYLLLQLSPWILVLVTIERVFSVLYPHRVRDVFTRRRVLIVLLPLVLFLSGLNAHLIYGYRLIFNEPFQRLRCEAIPEHVNFMFKFWTWIDFAFAFAIPFCVLLSGNITVVLKLKSSHNFRKRSTIISVNGSHSRGGSTCRQERTTSYFTVTAIILNITFVILVSPFSIFAIGQPYWFPVDTMTPERHAGLILTGTILLMILYTNNAVNFALYILCGTKFRRDFMNLFCRSRRRRRSMSETFSSNRTVHLSTISL
ncbi:kappa-type opioid receptor-like [Mercenaria mercenaria]|uniref:kappa-type opioid receptor-like n=1 Tax=Mercenaria mercenaria TaxID=6596 RepID=UPI00234EB69C|nr:kappa-type opioid receptor-like [Mercenaria mercenaria]